MKLTLAEPKYLKDSISIISELVNEGTFKVTPTAMELVAMDPANVAMVIFKLFSSSFMEYDVKKETELSINLSNLKQILRRCGQNDILSLEVTPDNKLQIQFKGKSTRTFSMPILESDVREQKIPQLEANVTVTTPSLVISDAVEDVGIVADSVTFAVDKNTMSIQAEGDLSKAHIEIPSDEGTSIKTQATDPVKAKYSIEYLKKIIAGSKISDNVELKFSKDYPLQVEFKEVDKVQLAFILAPRVDKD